MNKKLIALLLALALMFSSITAAFAEEAIGTDAAATVKLGMLKGEGNGVTADYLSTTPTRLQAAIMYLRLKGLEEEALAWTGTNNFPDAVDYAWEGGRNIMAYLKDHPELGWIGSDGMFLPNVEMNAQSYYKVMLEALGYKQNTAEVIGDFTWAGVFEFAAQVGLVKIADVANFTVNDIAIATMEALVRPVKGSETTLVASLIEAGKINSEIAIEVGIYTEPVDPAEVALAEAIAAAEEAIAALPAEITLEAKAAVEAARAAVEAALVLDAEATIAGIETLVAAEATIAELEAAAAEAAKALEVESVTATNLIEIVVKFNKVVDKTTAETAANYTLSAGTVTAATLADDNKTVTLTLNAAAAQQAKIDVTVKNVKDAAGVAMADTVKAVTMLDTTLPVIESIKVTGPKKLTVTFTEPMNTSGTAVLDNGTYFVSVPAMTAGSKTIDLTLGLSLPTGSHTIVLKNFIDMAGFKTVDTTLAFDYAVDTTAPTVSVKSATETVVTLTFDKAVKATNINTDVTAYHSINNIAAYKGTLAAVNPVNNYAKEYTVTFTTPLPAGAINLFLNTAENKLEDEWGNDVVSATLVVDVVTDVVKPTATVKATADNVIEVTFSEDVTELSAETKANFVFLDATGAVITNHGGLTATGNPDGSATMVYTSATKKLVITLDTALTGGTYAVKIANIKDKAFVANTMDEATIAFSVTDTTKPTVTKALVNTARTEIMVYFSEPMNAEGMTTTTNYYYILDGAAVASLPTGSTVAIIDTKTVKITLGTALAASFVAGGDDFVVVAGSLKDVTGNTIGGLSTQIATTADTITAANISKVQVNSLTNITFEVDRELSSIDVTKFTVDGTANSVTGATYVNGSGIATVTLIVDNATEDMVDDLSGITGNTIEMAAGALTSTFGTANSGAINIAKAAATQDKIAPKLVSKELTAQNTIVMTYSENIKAASVSLYTYTVAGNTVTNVSVAGAAVTITLGTNEAVNATPSITQALDIEDANGNKLAASGAVTAADKIAATVVTAAGDDSGDASAADTIAAGAIFTITFSEELSATGKTNVQSALTAVDADFTYAWNGAVLTVTNSHASDAATFAADVTANLEDVAGNATVGATIFEF